MTCAPEATLWQTECYRNIIYLVMGHISELQIEYMRSSTGCFPVAASQSHAARCLNDRTKRLRK